MTASRIVFSLVIRLVRSVLGAIGTQSLTAAGDIKRGAASTKTPPSRKAGRRSSARRNMYDGRHSAGGSQSRTRNDAVISERQRLDLLDLRQGLHLGEQVRRHRAVDLDQRDGIAAGRDAAEMEGRDIDFRITQ